MIRPITKVYESAHGAFSNTLPVPGQNLLRIFFPLTLLKLIASRITFDELNLAKNACMGVKYLILEIIGHTRVFSNIHFCRS